VAELGCAGSPDVDMPGVRPVTELPPGSIGPFRGGVCPSGVLLSDGVLTVVSSSGVLPPPVVAPPAPPAIKILSMEIAYDLGPALLGMASAQLMCG
jgi:hypothetical protein